MTAPPQAIRDIAAERVVLCGVLKAAELNLPVLLAKGVTEDAFSQWAHRLVWRAAVAVWNAGEDVGPYSVWFHLAKADELPELGFRPASWLAELWDEDPTGAWAAPAADTLLWVAARRAAYHRAMVVIRDAVAGCGPREVFEAAMATT